MFNKLTKIHWILIITLLFCLLVQTKEYFTTCDSNNFTNKCKKELKSSIFGVRSNAKFKNFVFQENKNCNKEGESTCSSNEYCNFNTTSIKCEVKPDESILNMFLQKKTDDTNFSLTGY